MLDSLLKKLRENQEYKETGPQSENKKLEEQIKKSEGRFSFHLSELAEKYSGYDPDTLIILSNAYSSHDPDKAIDYAMKAILISDNLEKLSNIDCKFTRTYQHKNNLIEKLLIKNKDNPKASMDIAFQGYLSNIIYTEQIDLTIDVLDAVHKRWPNDLDCLFNLANITFKRAKTYKAFQGLGIIKEKGCYARGNERFVKESIDLFKEFYSKTHNSDSIPDELKDFIIGKYRFAGANKDKTHQYSRERPQGTKTIEHYFSILGINHTTSYEDAHKRWKKLLTKYHTDKNPGNKEAEEKAKSINEAWAAIKKLLKQ